MNKLIITLKAPCRFYDEETFPLTGWRDSGLGDWLGFYDILRDDLGRPLGFRFRPFADAGKVIKSIPLSRRFRVEHGGDSICFLFGAADQWNEDKSEYLLFDETRLLFGPGGNVALLFDISYWRDSDREAIACAVAKAAFPRVSWAIFEGLPLPHIFAFIYLGFVVRFSSVFSAMTILLWAIGGMLVALFVYIAAMNWMIPIHYVIGKKSVGSAVPIVGAILGAIGLILFPVEGSWRYAWIPFFADFGSIPILLISLPKLLRRDDEK